MNSASSVLLSIKTVPSLWKKQIQASLQQMTLGISGWRKIFAANQSPNSTTTQISPYDALLVVVATTVLSGSFKHLASSPTCKKPVLLARDSRPTGRLICSLVHRVLRSHFFEVTELGILPITQAISYVQNTNNFCGLIYITASHNPPGYNGFKVIDSKGYGLSHAAMNRLITQFQNRCRQPAMLQKSVIQYRSTMDKTTATFKQNEPPDTQAIAASKEVYWDHMDRLCLGSEKQWKKPLIQALKRHRWSLLCDANGSARLRSIDKDYLKHYGVRLIFMNKQLGRFTHRIVPEGRSLLPLKEAMKGQSHRFLLGLAVDCDGDRGNFVLYRNNKPYLIDAQSTFALVVAAELATATWAAADDRSKKKQMAIITNEVTSNRIHWIGAAFGVRVFQAEVGEANILALAKKKEQQGFTVRIVGEGSNGGCMLSPSTVRDPLSSVMSVLKLLFLKDPPSSTTVTKERSVLSVLIQILHLSPDLLRMDTASLLYAIHMSLSRYVTTSVFEKRALILLKANNIRQIQLAYAKQFPQVFAALRTEWQQAYQFHSYTMHFYQGIREVRVTQTSFHRFIRSPSSFQGGFKIVFYNAQKRPQGFFWMRGSKTEPVCRLAVDVCGTKKDEKTLLEWHQHFIRSFIREKS